jgi:hypothetical protein
MANWIAGAIKHPGALHRQLHVPAGQKIPAAKLKSAAAKGGTLGRRANLAITLSRLRKGKRKGYSRGGSIRY